MPILLVEDDHDSRTVLSAILSNAGYHVLTAADGQEAIDMFDQGVRPRLMILDMMLPKVSGKDVLTYLQEDPQLRHLPVVILSGVPMKQIRAIADVIIAKPAEPKVILETIARVLREHPRADA